MNVSSRPSSRFYLSLMSMPTLWLCFEATNVSTASLIVLGAAVSAGAFPSDAKPLSIRRLSSSAPDQLRVFAERRYCLPLRLQCRCLRQSQRFQVSSSLYLQVAEWRTKIMMTWGAVECFRLAQNQHRKLRGVDCLQESPQKVGGGFGWGGWTRTNTVLINSEVSYQLDHAPAVVGDSPTARRANLPAK
jgi:hypothetical protein